MYLWWINILGGAMVEKLHSLHALSGLPSASYHVLLETKNTIQPTTPWLCKMIKRAIWNLGWFIVSNVQLSARGFILFSSPVYTHLRLLLYYLFPIMGGPSKYPCSVGIPRFSLEIFPCSLVIPFLGETSAMFPTFSHQHLFSMFLEVAAQALVDRRKSLL